MVLLPSQETGIRPSLEMGNIARCSTQSKYPLLWERLVGVYSPDAGVQGGKLVNFAGNAPDGVFGSTMTNANYRPGLGGPSLNFDAGAATEVDVGNTIINLNTDFSISAWIRIADITHNSYSIMGAAVKGLEASRSYFIFLHRLDRSGLCFQWQVAGAGAVFTAAPSINLTPNKWHHVGAVRAHNVNNIYLYQDGELILTRNGAITFANPTGQVWGLGCWDPPAGGNTFNGQISSLCLWNRAVTHDEMALLGTGASPLDMIS